ncbi:SMP-30/gluconolactonase/LRE family protein [Sphingomonas tabacisoli]|uniref:SMP-30/gluconolactonase/LRE family protein n=1 Tax=Sphingomonas tabacisoli TaxID=2249466 RepID=A0ABW4I1I2_9SPHN
MWDLGCELGEGALWSSLDEAVWFVDIKKRQIHRFRDDERRSWQAPEQVGFVLPAADGTWIAGLQSGLSRFDPESGLFDRLVPPDDHGSSQRLNDGYVDFDGRLWFGSMNDSEAPGGGKLYRLLSDGTCRVLDAPYTIPNGPAMSPDGRTFYHTETSERVIYAFDVAADGALSNRRPFVRIARAGAFPDGPLVDAEGCLWTALFGGWGLERYSPRGELIDYIRLPVPNVTKAAFGGPDLSTLYVTTARLHMSPAARAAHPLAGGLFRLETEVPGLPLNQIRQGL